MMDLKVSVLKHVVLYFGSTTELLSDDWLMEKITDRKGLGIISPFKNMLLVS